MNTHFRPDNHQIQFSDVNGKPVKHFDKMIAPVLTAGAVLLKAEKSDSPKVMHEAREELSKAVLGAAYRPRKIGGIQRDYRHQISRDFVLREWEGRPWVAQVRQGEEERGDWPLVTALDLNSLGTYYETYTVSSENTRYQNIETYLDLSIRKMGAYVRAKNMSPDSSDRMSCSAESGFWCYYTPSRDCRLEMRGIAVQTYSRCTRELTDEGFLFAPEVSNCRVSHDNLLVAGFFIDWDTQGTANYGKFYQSVGPGGAYYGDGANSEPGGPYDYEEGSGAPDIDFLVRDGNRTLEFGLRPTVTVRQGEQVSFFIGAQSFIEAHLDDVKADIRQGGSWTLLHLEVAEI